MAAKSIVIRNQNELSDIEELLNNGQWTFSKLARLLNGNTRSDQLNRWLVIEGVNICARGRKALLADTKSKSWTQYIRKHWEDDEMRTWVRNELGLQTYSWTNGRCYTKDEFFAINSSHLRCSVWPFKK